MDARGFKEQVEHLVRHQSVGENTERGVRHHRSQSGVEDSVEAGVKGGLAAHEVDDRSGFDLGQQFAGKKVELHGFPRRLHRFFHVLVCKTVIARQVAITV